MVKTITLKIIIWLLFMQTKLISQADNFASNFGLVLRSSAVFYYMNDEEKCFSTKISFMNYWKHKNGLEVFVIANTRDMKGRLLLREELSFEKTQVWNYQPDIGAKKFEGSVEIEVFALKNMRIPYAAIMAVYESKKGISLVHSYARSYSQFEIEEDRVITESSEAGWTIRDDLNIKSFGIFHNGSEPQLKQDLTIKIINQNNEAIQRVMELPDLNPFETVKIYPAEIFPDLNEFLSADIGSASISYKLKNAFTRMLVGHETLSIDDFQVTHSNFDYSAMRTDLLETNKPAYMKLPYLENINSTVIVYPFSHDGNYKIVDGDSVMDFSSGRIVQFKPETRSIQFESKEKMFPTRLVTGLAGGKAGVMPFECSLGVAHENKPLKRLWWMPVYITSKIECYIYALMHTELFGDSVDAKVNIRCYSSFSMGVIEATVSIDKFRSGRAVALQELIPESSDHLANNPGYITFYSEYPGFNVYVLHTKGASCSFEHGF